MQPSRRFDTACDVQNTFPPTCTICDVSSASGGFAPDLHQRLCSWTPLRNFHPSYLLQNWIPLAPKKPSAAPVFRIEKSLIDRLLRSLSSSANVHWWTRKAMLTYITTRIIVDFTKTSLAAYRSVSTGFRNNKKLSCHRETARCFVSFNISPSQPSSLEPHAHLLDMYT